MTTLITGSSGKTAAYLAQLLAADGSPILVASRSPKTGASYPTVRFDWLDESTWEHPFSHEQSQSSPIGAVYLVAPDVDSARAKVIPFVKYAMQKGVKRFTLLSAWENPEGGPLLGGAHADLKALEKQGAEWAVLRPHFFMGTRKPAQGVGRNTTDDWQRTFWKVTTSTPSNQKARSVPLPTMGRSHSSQPETLLQLLARL